MYLRGYMLQPVILFSLNPATVLFFCPSSSWKAVLADSNKEVDGRILRRKEADDREFKRIDDSVRGRDMKQQRVGMTGGGGA